VVIRKAAFKQEYLDQAIQVINQGNAPEDGFGLCDGEYTGMNPAWGDLAPIISIGILSCVNEYVGDYNRVWFETWINRVQTVRKQRYNRHNHVEINRRLNRPEPNYTWVYYLQMPNNLSGEEGKLNVEGWGNYLPMVGDLVILDGNTYHSVFEAPNSTVDRIVLAGNVAIQNNKTKRSLM